MDICDIPVISSVCQTAGEAATNLVVAPFEWLAHSMGAAASWLIEAVWQVFDTTTLVDVTRPEYVAIYNILFGIAVFVMLLFFCLQLITGLVHRDPTALSRAALGLGKSVLGSFILVTLTALLLEITDQLCLGIVQATGQSMQTMGDKIVLLMAGLSTINIAAPGVGALLTIFLAGLAIAATAIVWFSLLVRKALILVAVVFGPFALAGLTWDIAKGWVGKWASFVVAMILSKLVVTVIFLVAVAQVAAPITPDLTAITEPLAGIVLLAIAGFAPYMAYKFISFVGFDMYAAMSMEQEAKSAMNRPVPVPNLPNGGMPPKQVLEGGKSGGGDAPPKPDSAPAPATENAATSAPAAGASEAGAGAGAGASAGAGAGAGVGGAAAAGPAAPVALGAMAVQKAATAGPELGGAIGNAADGQVGAAEESATPPSAPAAQQPPAVLPPSPAPSTPPPASPPPSSSAPTGE